MGNKNVLKIVATLTVKDPKDQKEIEKALHAVVDATRTEEGNVSYILHQDVNNSLVYIFIEEWKSPEAIAAHNASAHFEVFKNAVAGKVDLSVSVVKAIY